MNFTIAKLLFGVLLVSYTITSNAFAAVSYVSATNSASLVETFDEGEERIFVFGGIADGESSVLTFSTDSPCPGVAMTGGAEFIETFSCSDGVITATVTNRGGMSFGPSPEGNPGTFYVTFSDPPTPPGMDSAPAALAGIQIAVFGDVSSWDLSGDINGTGVTFGIELSGTEGGDAHFRMYLPKAAVDFLGGVLGVYVGGKPDPFATVTTNDDGSVDIKVDIASLKSENTGASKLGSNISIVTKKITAGPRTLGLGFSKTSVKTGKSVVMAMCSGTEFTSGDKVPVKFTVGGKAVSLSNSFTLDSTGCGRTTVKLKSVSVGTLTAKISYKGAKAKSTVKVSK